MASGYRRDFAQNLDLRPLLQKGAMKRRHRFSLPFQWRAVGVGLITAFASGGLTGSLSSAPVTAKTQTLSPSISPTLSTSWDPLPSAPEGPKPTTRKEPSDTNGSKWQSYVLTEGETLSQLGHRVGIGTSTILHLAQAASDVYPVRQMRPGHVLKFHQGEDGDLASARYRIDDSRYLSWQTKDQGGFSASIQSLPKKILIKEAFGRIQSSLFEAGADAGLSRKTTMRLAQIFGWDIDFAHDLHPGDWFRVLYQVVYRHGQKVNEGKILAAEFTTQGESHKAFRFTDGPGKTNYYHPDGRSVRKAFLRSPVKYTRITSRFSRSRKHPILDRRRAHKGVDYGAPTGTPVRATGDGRLTFRGWKGGYGRVVMIHHANRFTTVYAHLSRFASAHVGEQVKQGECIGYVGQSGLATGPHLHYEFRVRGVHQNPLTVELPQAEGLPEHRVPAFKRRRHHLMAWLKAVGPQKLRLATAQDPGSSS